jgi:hypothetical protein
MKPTLLILTILALLSKQSSFAQSDLSVTALLIAQCQHTGNMAYCDSALKLLTHEPDNEHTDLQKANAYYHIFRLEQEKIFAVAKAEMGTQYFTPRRAYQTAGDSVTDKLKLVAKSAQRHLLKVQTHTPVKNKLHELNTYLEQSQYD